MRKLLTALVFLGAAACERQVACVARGTRVKLPNGTRLIEELQVGDDVVCVDPENGQQHPTKITAIRSAKRECVRLLTAHSELVLTSDHPLYCPKKKEWAPAGDWALEQRVQLLQVNDETVEVTLVTQAFAYSGVHEVFDLSVEHPLHNFVANGLLVHNKVKVCSFPGGTVTAGSKCNCPVGDPGRFECEESGMMGACICTPPVVDAGDVDAGTDAGTDAGAVDAGP